MSGTGTAWWRRALDYGNTRPIPRTHKIIWTVVIAMLSFGWAFYGPAPAAHANVNPSLATGVHGGCQIKFYGFTPYYHCFIVVQPGSTQAMQQYLGEHPGPLYEGAVIAEITLACAAITPPLGPVCGFYAGVFWWEIGQTVNKAAYLSKCAEFDVDVPNLSSGSGFSTNPTGGGAWLYEWINGERYQVWGDTNSGCHAVSWNDSRNPWWYGWHCDDAGLNKALSIPYCNFVFA